MMFVFAALVAVTPVMPKKEPAMVEKARAERLQRLTTDDGWLTLVGLAWLSPGKQTMGRASDNAIVVDSANAADHLGTVELSGDTVTFTAVPGAGAMSAGKPITTTLTLVSDNEGKPTLVSQGTVSFYVIDRGGKLGLRIKDAKSPRRVAFSGLSYFPEDPTWRVEASFTPAATAKKVRVPTVAGVEEEHVIPGTLSFTRGADRYELVPLDDGEDLMIVFADATSGKETYGAARFLYAKKPVHGRVTLDFNLAENPPCAFTPYATCPLPPTGNRLKVRVEAGEKTPAGHF